MQPELGPGRKVAAAEMGIEVAQNQHRLEEQHGRGPDGGRTSDLWQDHARVKRLHEEQQERTEQDRQREEQG